MVLSIQFFVADPGEYRDAGALSADLIGMFRRGVCCQL